MDLFIRNRSDEQDALPEGSDRPPVAADRILCTRPIHAPGYFPRGCNKMND
jgi:hypothetical protein